MQTGEIVIYENVDGQAAIEGKLENGSIWLSLNQISDLFGRDKSVIYRHLRNIYKERELSREATVAKNATVQKGGDRELIRSLEYYNLDAIL